MQITLLVGRDIVVLAVEVELVDAEAGHVRAIRKRDGGRWRREHDVVRRLRVQARPT